MELSEKETNGDIEIRVIASVALRYETQIRVRRDDTYIMLSGPEIEDNVYTYQTEINNSITNGTAFVYVTVYTVESERLTLSDDYIIDRDEQ
ncbi:hypothetical protein SAMN04488587_1891 [Methanococcoides vulcani]|uniref:Uncharacterized protein n=1 Tax=Methanococcoides vulcani TaxID=1353158 RepID=A0A1I0B124_9EURY|nr:hypothetical protein [Methanococcoides vulcani]SET00427.1 hypothetical protein SAMN04488587_1891 [Methanococcoides vulcani]